MDSAANLIRFLLYTDKMQMKEFGLPQNRPDLRDSWIVPRSCSAANLIGIFHHRAELKNAKGFVFVSSAQRPVEDRKPVLNKNRNPDDDVERNRNDKKGERDDEPDHSLYISVVKPIVSFLHFFSLLLH